jgi:hypothetical protein
LYENFSLGSYALKFELSRGKIPQNVQALVLAEH